MDAENQHTVTFMHGGRSDDGEWRYFSPDISAAFDGDTRTATDGQCITLRVSETIVLTVLDTFSAITHHRGEESA
jgi:hypothetical protein